MEIAVNGAGARVSALKYFWQEEMFCPICGSPVIHKNGKINIPHFAHEKGSACDDSWNYDMSVWHQRMQSYFPEENREVVVERDGKKHRADILIGNTVIEFQHSSITAAEFQDRNDFFIQCGYRIAWVFDLVDDFFSKRIREEAYDWYEWRRPMRIFAVAPSVFDTNSNFALWFHHASANGVDMIARVVDCESDDNGNRTFKQFRMHKQLSLRLGQESYESVVEHLFCASGKHAKEYITPLLEVAKERILEQGVTLPQVNAFVNRDRLGNLTEYESVSILSHSEKHDMIKIEERHVIKPDRVEILDTADDETPKLRLICGNTNVLVCLMDERCFVEQIRYFGDEESMDTRIIGVSTDWIDITKPTDDSGINKLLSNFCSGEWWVYPIPEHVSEKARKEKENKKNNKEDERQSKVFETIHEPKEYKTPLGKIFEREEEKCPDVVQAKFLDPKSYSGAPIRENTGRRWVWCLDGIVAAHS